MSRKIPSNSALQAFEAAARHGSFARAAEELSRTEGAVSRQIGRLEAFLGVTLFERIGNRVRLAPNGARYAGQVREILDRLERELALVRRHGYARDNEALELGVRGIAAGIFDDTGKLVAGLSISAPAERLQDDWIPALVDTAASISEALGYEPSVSSGFNGLGMAAEALRP